eukprot:TRINITY_DN3921_c0_g1_i1.p1 TRINITY_DN3921_c0_g1~~TRINITY_DN3921_c0_g1_i1.p1  ORF type:complete len:736 (+),score=154.43 TRINITY_DN3921_c0_g1_i1:123-2330(+)
MESERPDRYERGIYLHRSETHAHREVDPRSQRATRAARAAARGRKEGQNGPKAALSKEIVETRTLGPLREPKEIVDMCMSKVNDVERMCQQVVASMHAQHVEPKEQRSAEWSRHPDGGKDDDNEEKERSDDPRRLQLQQQNGGARRMDGGRLGVRPPRLVDQADGMDLLREFVRDSEQRVQRVKALTPGMAFGLRYDFDDTERLMPPRELYAPATASKRLQGPSIRRAAGHRGGICMATIDAAGAMPNSARAVVQTTTEDAARLVPRPPSQPLHGQPRPVPGKLALPIKDSPRDPGRAREVYMSGIQTERKPRPLPVQLPSLKDFIASSAPGAAGDRAGVQGDKGQHRKEHSGKRKVNYIRRIEKHLEGAWADRAFWKRCISVQSKDIDDLKQRCRGHDQSVALLERFLEDGGFGGGGVAGTRGIPTSGGGGVGGGTAVGGGGNGEAAKGDGDDGSSRPMGSLGETVTGGNSAPAGSGRQKRGLMEGGEKPPPEEDKEAAAYAKFVQLLREPDPNISPVSRLRATLGTYDVARDQHREYLETVLFSMEADRLDSFKRRYANLDAKSQGVQAVAKSTCALMRIDAERDMLEQHLDEAMIRQYWWYRSLWTMVESEKRALPPVAHWIFDFMKRVLEAGKLFSAAMYFAMLRKIENNEFIPVIACLVVNMISEIDGITTDSLVEWFERNRGTVPPHVYLFIQDPVWTGESSPGSPSPREASGGGSASVRGTTFVTDVP